MSLAVQFEGDSFLSSEGFFYILSVPWKVLCAGIPPPRIANGWVCFSVTRNPKPELSPSPNPNPDPNQVCFSVTLCVIGILTAIIGDLAAHVCCTMGL